MRVGISKDKVRVMIDDDEIVSGGNVVSKPGQVESVVDVEWERGGFGSHLAELGDCIRVECGEAIDVVGLIQDLDTNDVVDFDELLDQIGEDVHGELDICRIVKQVLNTVRDSRVALAILGSRCTVKIDEDTESVFFGPVDSSDDASPRVDIGSRNRFERCALAVGRTEGPVPNG